MRRTHGHLVQQQARPLAAGQVGDGGLLLVEAQAPLGELGAARAFRRFGHGAADDLQRRVGGVQRLDLVLVEPAHLHPAVAVHLAVHGLQRAGDHLGEGGLAGAIDA